jgi:hypothetical protein
MCIERECVHIDRADEVAVAAKPAGAARPSSALGLVTMPAAGTPAAGSSFGAGEAQDAGLLRFMGQVINVTAVFPLRHAAIVMPAGVPVAHAMRIADEERPHLVLDAEVDYLPGGLVPKITDAPLGPAAHLVPGALQFLPAAGVFGATALLFGDLPELLAALPFERSDAAPGDDQGCARVGGHSGQVDFPEIHRRLHRAGCRFRRHDFHADMQLEAPVPNERAGPSVHGKRKEQRQRRVAFAHRQDDSPLLAVDGLGGPLDRVEPLGAPGILHAHLGMFPAQPARGCDIGEKDVNDLLNRLSVEREAALGGLFQFTLSRPRRMSQTCLLVRLHAQVPHTCRFLLRLLEAAEERWRQIGQAIHTNYFHANLFFLSTRNAVMSRNGSKPSGGRFHPVLSRETGAPTPFCRCAVTH